MCQERKRTRDRLLNISLATTPIPHNINYPNIYPWENMSVNILAKQLFKVACNAGFAGTESVFLQAFGNFAEEQSIIYGTLEEFPLTGEINKLYFDINDKILYYWDINKYSPINATLIANTIINGGEA